jgi:thiosulfate dehydrogenase
MVMKKYYRVTLYLSMALVAFAIFISCSSEKKETVANGKQVINTDTLLRVDTSKIPDGKFGEAVRYGRELMLNTAYYIGPDGVNGKYLGNKMNCTNCHQDAGTKLYSFNLMGSHDDYPQYRSREGKVLTMAERVNNCVMHPHSGKALPLDSREMVGFLSYFKWINEKVPKGEKFQGKQNLQVSFPDSAASPERGSVLFVQHCARCHGADGQGVMLPNNITYLYPPLWGPSGYQPGSSMHRVIKQAQWLKANMPQDKATWDKPILTDAEALDLAAFVNDDAIHSRPNKESVSYPNIGDKSIDFDAGPYIDTFSEAQHKYGPYQPIISYWKSKDVKPVY